MHVNQRENVARSNRIPGSTTITLSPSSDATTLMTRRQVNLLRTLAEIHLGRFQRRPDQEPKEVFMGIEGSQDEIERVILTDLCKVREEEAKDPEFDEVRESFLEKLPRITKGLTVRSPNFLRMSLTFLLLVGKTQVRARSLTPNSSFGGE